MQKRTTSPLGRTLTVRGFLDKTTHSFLKHASCAQMPKDVAKSTHATTLACARPFLRATERHPPIRAMGKRKDRGWLLPELKISWQLASRSRYERELELYLQRQQLFFFHSSSPTTFGFAPVYQHNTLTGFTAIQTPARLVLIAIQHASNNCRNGGYLASELLGVVISSIQYPRLA